MISKPTEHGKYSNWNHGSFRISSQGLLHDVFYSFIMCIFIYVYIYRYIHQGTDFELLAVIALNDKISFAFEIFGFFGKDISPSLESNQFLDMKQKSWKLHLGISWKAKQVLYPIIAQSQLLGR